MQSLVAPCSQAFTAHMQEPDDPASKRQAISLLGSAHPTKYHRDGTHRSYADDVRNEMTRPRTVPSTVSIALENTSLCGVNWETRVTTCGCANRRQVLWQRRHLHGRLTRGNTREEEYLWPNIIDHGGLELLQAPSREERVLCDHPERGLEGEDLKPGGIGWSYGGGINERIPRLLPDVLVIRRTSGGALDSRNDEQQLIKQAERTKPPPTPGTEEGGKGREGTVGRRVGPACEPIWRPAASRASGSRTRTPSSKRTPNGHGHGDLCWADARVRALIEFKFTTAESRRLPDSLLPSVGPGSHREQAQRDI